MKGSKYLSLFLIATITFSCNNQHANEGKNLIAIDSSVIKNNGVVVTIIQPKEATTDTILEIIRNLPEVRKVANEIETLSNHTRHVSYRVLYEDSTNTVYNIIVGEDNGMSVATYFNFRIDAKTFKILSSEKDE